MTFYSGWERCYRYPTMSIPMDHNAIMNYGEIATTKTMIPFICWSSGRYSNTRLCLVVGLPTLVPLNYRGPTWIPSRTSNSNSNSKLLLNKYRRNFAFVKLSHCWSDTRLDCRVGGVVTRNVVTNKFAFFLIYKTQFICIYRIRENMRDLYGGLSRSEIGLNLIFKPRH